MFPRPAQRLGIEFLFLAVLLIAGGAVLAVTVSPRAMTPLKATAYLASTAALAILWQRAARRPAAVSPSDVALPGSRVGWWAMAALFGVLTFICFFRPMQMDFWGGVDDWACFQDPVPPLWDAPMDGLCHRPMSYLSVFVSRHLTPNSINGIFWLAGALWFAAALLLATLVRQVLPGRSDGLAGAAGALMIVCRAEPSRFFVMWTGNWYVTTLTVFLAALNLFVWSFRRERREALVLGCVALGVSLLTSEAPFPLTLIAPLLLLGRPRESQRDWGRIAVWSSAWIGTVGVLACRFVYSVLTHGQASYQVTQAGASYRDPTALATNLATQTAPLLSYFDGMKQVTLSPALWLGVFAIAGLAVYLAGDSKRQVGRGHLWALLLAALAVVLGVLPFLHMAYVFRTQFLSAAGQAALCAIALSFVVSFLPGSLQRLGLSLLAGFFVANATIGIDEDRKQSMPHNPVSFEKTVHALQQLRRVSPTLPAGTMVLLVRDPQLPWQLGHNISLDRLSHGIFGASCFQANFKDRKGNNVVFEKDTCEVLGKVDRIRSAPYSRVIAFRHMQDGTLCLLRQLPAELFADGQAPSDYNPLPLLQAGTPTPLGAFTYPWWIAEPVDVFDDCGAVLPGAGWGPLHEDEQGLFRRVRSGAEIVVNPAGQAEQCLAFAMTAPRGAESIRIMLKDDTGATVAETSVAQRRDVRLRFQTDINRVRVFTLHCEGTTAAPSEGNPSSFRIYRPGAPVQRAETRHDHDVTSTDLRIGGRWYPLETYRSRSFRWIDDGAELVLADWCDDNGSLALDVEPGPSLGEQPLHLRVVTTDERVLLDTHVKGRQKLVAPLPRGAGPGTVVRLHAVDSPHVRFSSDTRTLNFRVFDARLTNP
jgi:hypothetical protein